MCLFSLSAFGDADKNTPPTATPAVVSEKVKVNTFTAHESHWITTYAFEGTKYQTNYQYDGVKKDFKPGEQEIWGGRIGFGGEIYLGKGFVTTSKAEGYFLGTLFSKALNAGADLPIEYSSTKRTSQMYGIDFAQSLGYIFDVHVQNPFMEQKSIIYMEPFLEAGIGYGKAFNKINYVYDTSLGGGEVGTSGEPVESYRHKMDDNFVSQRVSAGMNITSSQGFFLQVKVTSSILDVTSRKESVLIKENTLPIGTTQVTNSKNPKLDPIVIYTLGGGYKF